MGIATLEQADSHPGLAAAVIATLAVVGCGPLEPQGPNPPTLPAFIAAEIDFGPDGRCFGRDIAPAVLETVTAQVQEAPAVLAEDGSILTPATYRSEISQQIVRERQEVAFETLCPPAYTEEFVATLQRALAVRGLYAGPVNGLLDQATGQAVQAFQRDAGPDSPLLSITAARRLGIVALSANDLAILNE